MLHVWQAPSNHLLQPTALSHWLRQLANQVAARLAENTAADTCSCVNTRQDSGIQLRSEAVDDGDVSVFFGAVLNQMFGSVRVRLDLYLRLGLSYLDVETVS